MTEHFKFPTGEVHVRLEEPKRTVFVPILNRASNFNLNDWLMTVLLECDTNARFNGGHFQLLLPYLPYSRQDRQTTEGDAFSLKMLGNILNTFPIDRVITFDVHSDVAFACVNNLVSLTYKDMWLSRLHELCSHPGLWPLEEKVLVIPDQGAVKKLSHYADQFKSTVIGIKHRNTETGRVSVEGIYGYTSVMGNDCLIVDDICDGGGTFIQLAKLLYERGARSVDLMVTHGIFTKGIRVLFDAGIKNIFTTDSFQQVINTNLFTLSTEKIMTAYYRRNMLQQVET
jgi:ribose-phosphate pyrophosphokinase